MTDSSTAFVEVGSSLEPLRSPFLMALGERVRNLRSRKGMTRKAVALSADVSERHLANLEYGTGNVSVIPRLTAIARRASCIKSMICFLITGNINIYLISYCFNVNLKECFINFIAKNQLMSLCWVTLPKRFSTSLVNP